MHPLLAIVESHPVLFFVFLFIISLSPKDNLIWVVVRSATIFVLVSQLIFSALSPSGNWGVAWKKAFP